MIAESALFKVIENKNFLYFVKETANKKEHDGWSFFL